MTTIHQFKVEGIDGSEIDFAAFKGKKIMVVNVASECGFTPQYQQLQEIFVEFGDKIIIVGFPSNEFGNKAGLIAMRLNRQHRPCSSPIFAKTL